MPKVRVLVVDDSVVIRKILSDAIATDPDLEVVGTAANGKIALQKITQINPDIITLDVEMPEMDGLETLTNIRKTYPKIPIIMFSTLTEKGANVTLEALANGASDYVTKPANVGSVTNSKEAVQQELIRKIKSLTSTVSGIPITSQPVKPITPRKIAIKPSKSKVDVLTIGVSTGGPNALAEIMPKISKNFPVPIVIVQHMPPMFTKLLAERLDAQSELTIKETAGNEELLPGTAYIAPGNFHMTIARKGGKVITQLNQDHPENSCRPAVDVLFRSVVQTYGSGTLGLILTGMGQDGLIGCELIKEFGGSVVTQDKATSVVWGMPGYVTEAGLSDAVLPLQKIAEELELRARSGRLEQSQTQRNLNPGAHS